MKKIVRPIKNISNTRALLLWVIFSVFKYFNENIELELIKTFIGKNIQNIRDRC